MCYAYDHKKAGNCPMSRWVHVYQDIPTTRLFAVSLGLYPLKDNTLSIHLLQFTESHPLTVLEVLTNSSTGSVDSLGR